MPDVTILNETAEVEIGESSTTVEIHQESAPSVEVSDDGITVELTNEKVELEIEPSQTIVEINQPKLEVIEILKQGPAGPPGPQGETGPQGPAGTGGSGTQNLFIQNSAPVTSEATYLWVQTGLGDGDDLTFWVENGS